MISNKKYQNPHLPYIAYVIIEQRFIGLCVKYGIRAGLKKAKLIALHVINKFKGMHAFFPIIGVLNTS